MCRWGRTHSQPGPGNCVPFLAGVKRHDLSRIRPPIRIEHAAQLAHRVERALGKDRFHVSHLVEPDAVLAGDAAARIDARPHDLGHRLMHSLSFFRIVRAVGDVGMKISITGMKDITNHDTVFLADIANRVEYLRQTRSRDYSILNDQVGCHPPHGPKRLLSSLPQLHPLRIIARHLHIACASIDADPPHSFEIRRDASLEPVEPDKEDRLRIPRIARGVDGILDYTNGRTIHELQCRWYDPGGDDRGSHVRRGVDRHEISEQSPHRLRLGSELDGDVQSEPEAAFRSNERATQIVAIALADLAAKLDDLTTRQDDRQRQNMVECDAVLEAVRTTSVLSDIAANRARRFARRVRRVQQPVRRDVLIEPQIYDTGLEGGASIVDIERDDLFETVDSNDD